MRAFRMKGQGQVAPSVWWTHSEHFTNLLCNLHATKIIRFTRTSLYTNNCCDICDWIKTSQLGNCYAINFTTFLFCNILPPEAAGLHPRVHFKNFRKIVTNKKMQCNAMVIMENDHIHACGEDKINETPCKRGAFLFWKLKMMLDLKAI